MNGEELWLQLRRMIFEYEQARDPDTTEIGQQFANLQRMMIEKKDIYPSIEGAKSINRMKNRYKDVLPYDKYRVVLQSGRMSDYINASFVEDLEGHRRYIAAQGPIDESIEDFFQMIWELQITSIICAANDTEAGRFKFRRYWPDDENCLEFNTYRISLNQTDDRAYHCEFYQIRPLIISQGNSHRHVLLYHLLQWFDHDVPSSEEPIYELLIRLEKDRTTSPQTPILVHCSAGCGRTGSLIAIDLIRLFLQDEKLRSQSQYQPYPVYKITSHIRQYRIALIQTIKQYLFVHKMFVYMLQMMGYVAALTHHDPLEEYLNNSSIPASSSSSIYSSSPSKSTRRSSGPFLNLRNPPIGRRSNKNGTSKTSPAVLQTTESLPVSSKNEAGTESSPPPSPPPPIPPRSVNHHLAVAPTEDLLPIKRRIPVHRSRPTYRRAQLVETYVHTDPIKSNRSDSADALSSPTVSTRFDDQPSTHRAGVIIDHGANSD